MTCAERKALKTADFMAPNLVLCYGGGGAFQGVAPYMLACGINIRAVIAANKQGTISTGGRELSYLSLPKALERYGTGVIVIITIANVEIFQQVRQSLIEHGFSKDRIFDLNVWTWLTKPSEKSCCKELGGFLQFFESGLSKCCKAGVFEAYLCEWFMEGRPLQESIENFLEKRLYYLEQSKKGNIPLFCKDCRFLTQVPDAAGTDIERVVFSDCTFCNSDCVYCGDACSIPRKKVASSAQERYEAALCALERLQMDKQLNERAVIQFADGEITVNPCRNRIFETVKRLLARSPQIQIRFFSNGFLYDQEIADILSLGEGSFLQCDLDAGTPETYIKVKGFNKFETVRRNLKRYARYGTVKLKYIILPGWNDSQEDFEGTIALLKDLGCKELQLSLEFEISRGVNRWKLRESLFAAARLMVLLERNGLQAVFFDGAFDGIWKKEHLAIAKRLCRELQQLAAEQEGCRQ